MGNVLKELGKLEEAHDCYLKAISIDPDIPGVYVNLADSKKFVPGDPHLAIMESACGEDRTAYRRPTACSSISGSARSTRT